MIEIELERLLGYILSELGCTHPFRISRIIALAELEYYEGHKKRMTALKYKGFNKVFYIEGLKEVIEGSRCFRVREGDPEKGVKGCIEYYCPKPVIPNEYKQYVDRAISLAKSLSDEELNKQVFDNPLFHRLLRPM